MLEPVRTSFRTGNSLVWTRVNDLPDFVFFDHSIHVNKGVGCYSCHGPIDRMPLTFAAHSLQMEWCIDCHRNPEKELRPREQVFNMEYTQPANQEQLGLKLAKEYHLRSSTDITTCWTCHR